MLHPKEQAILNYLYQSTNGYQTSKEIGDSLSWSDRTIRTYIKSLMELDPEDSGFKIEAKHGSGYILRILDDRKIRTYIDNHGAEKGNDVEERINFLLNKLLFEQSSIHFDQLEEELFVSRSTLSSDFKQIRERLNPYELQIKSKAHRGIYLSGSERNKRRFIMDYFFQSTFFDHLKNYIEVNAFTHHVSIEELTLIVIDECREGKLKVSDYVMQNLVVHLALALRRLSEGFVISKVEHIDLERFSQEQKVALAIMRRIESITGMVLPEGEVDYLVLHLSSKTYNQYEPRADYDRLKLELVKVLKENSFLAPYELDKDLQFIEGVATHLQLLAIRLENNIQLDNPLLEEVLKQDPGSVRMSRDILNVLPFFRHQNITNDEVAYVALHVMAAVERKKEEEKINVLVICATGFGSAQLLRHRLTQEFGSLIHITDVIGYYELTEERIQGIDCIISTIDLSNLVFTVPVKIVSVFLHEEEVIKLRSELQGIQTKQPMFKDTILVSGSLDEIFDSYFGEDYFIHSESLTDKSEVLNVLISSLANSNNDNFRERMYSGISQREELSTVVFSEDIAVPHPIKPVMKEHRIAVAILPNGIYWNDDFPKIQFVFLISPSIFTNEGLDKIAAKLVQLTDDSEKRSSLLKTTTFDEFRTVFLKQ